MKIILCAHHFPPKFTSGAVLRAYRLARWLVQAGHQVKVICIEDVADETQGDGLGIQSDVYEGIEVERLSFNLKTWPEPIRWSYDNPLLYDYFATLFAHEKPDLLHLISGYLLGIAPLQAAENLDIPKVVTLTDFWFLCPTIQLLRGDGDLCWGPEPAECVRCWLNRWTPFHWLETHLPILTRPVPAYLRNDIFVPSVLQEKMAIFADRHERLIKTLNKAQALTSITQFLADIYIQNGAKAELFHILPYRQLQNNQSTSLVNKVDKPIPDKVRFGYLGVISPNKGVELLVRAFKRLPFPQQTQLTFFGPVYPDFFAEKLKKLAKDLPVSFAGRYEQEQLPQIMKEIDVVIVPSLWHENTPRTIVEAFQYDKPVIGTNVGGIAALVDDEVNGFLFERNNVDSLAEQMQKFISTPELVPIFTTNIPMLDVGNTENESVFSVYQQIMTE